MPSALQHRLGTSSSIRVATASGVLAMPEIKAMLRAAGATEAYEVQGQGTASSGAGPVPAAAFARSISKAKKSCTKPINYTALCPYVHG